DYTRLRPGARLRDLSRREFPRCVAECERAQSAPETSDRDAPRLGREVDRVISHCRARTRDPNGIRTRVTAVKGRCPRPLDDRVRKSGGNIRSWLGRCKLFAKAGELCAVQRWSASRSKVPRNWRAQARLQA